MRPWNKHSMSRPNGHILAAALIAGVVLFYPLKTAAAELIMFESSACPWCATFDHEIGSIYPKTVEGKRAPLRRVDIFKPLPPDLAFIEVERLTPLFVLVDRGREIGRIRGYPGEDHFWGLLGILMKKLDAATVKGEPQNTAGKPLHASR
jgi:hypothetical protein